RFFFKHCPWGFKLTAGKEYFPSKRIQTPIAKQPSVCPEIPAASVQVFPELPIGAASLHSWHSDDAVPGFFLCRRNAAQRL
ncbi:MAG TPA: hypothetical protein VK840_00745, partial [Candidatus Dormibacteraeota bacterium]|nr:hypothetical protein [Candidatus Dormibacteraeota bacterium]